MNGPLRVYIIDCHDEVRRALAARLKTSPDIAVVGDTGDADEGLQKTTTLQPDILLVETKRSDGRGLEIVKAIAQSELKTKVIVLTSYASEWERVTMAHSGAARYLLKDIASAQLIEEIRAVMRQEPETMAPPK
ncbi:MAG: response regulator transcription factor [Chloroflexi bacterium]|nr:response regulator transcription factor [Chloroflexota bacterium]